MGKKCKFQKNLHFLKKYTTIFAYKFIFLVHIIFMNIPKIKKHSRKTRLSGFTLVELIVVITILSIL